MSKELQLTAYERGWNTHDPDACAACFTPDGVRVSLVRDAPRAATGRDAIRDAIALAMGTMPGLALEVVAVGYASDRRLWTEWRATGTPGASDVRMEIPGVSVFRISNAGFVEERVYWDSASVR